MRTPCRRLPGRHLRASNKPGAIHFDWPRDHCHHMINYLAARRLVTFTIKERSLRTLPAGCGDRKAE